MSTILVTGTAGFIGFHLARRLLALGHRVVGVDNMNDYYDVVMKRKRNEILLAEKNYAFLELDIADFEKLLAVVKKEKPSCVIHLAAQAGVRYSLTNPWAYERSNLLGTMNVFECAKQCKIPRVLYASTGSVYGANTKKPFSEDDRVDSPVSIYGATKRATELLAHSYYHMYGIEMVSLRFFTAYGTYGRPDLALFKFTKNILLGKPIDVYNNGDMKRTFTFIDDIVAGIVACIDKKKHGYAIYNLAGGESISLMDYVALIEKIVGKKAVVRMLPMQDGDMKEAIVDISKARKELGYEPKTSIRDGVKIFVDWFVKNKEWLMKLSDVKQ